MDFMRVSEKNTAVPEELDFPGTGEKSEAAINLREDTQTTQEVGGSIANVSGRSLTRASASAEEADLLSFIYAHFPHRWLNRKAEGTKRLFNGLFKCLDYTRGFIDILVMNSQTRTAVELLPELEDEYGLAVNPSLDIKVRRGKIIAQKRMQDWPVTREQLLEILRALGVEAYIVNYHNEQRMEFEITENTLNIPYGDIYGLLNDNVRAHIDLSVVACVDSEAAGGILVGTVSMQHAEYENTTLEHSYKLSYGAVLYADVGSRSMQELIIETPQREEQARTVENGITANVARRTAQRIVFDNTALERTHILTYETAVNVWVGSRAAQEIVMEAPSEETEARAFQERSPDA